MTALARVPPIAQRGQTRRQYSKWANSETLEDYALRFTAASARRWSMRRIAGTAFGAASFLACEAIGATITLAYGTANAAAAIVAAMVLMFVVGLPIAYHAAKAGLDVDLLTRGAGFGYIGSTITSLIYASFTFLLFAIEASIMSMALQLILGIPLAVAHLIAALVVIPVALYGMRAITRMQTLTQPVWLVLQLAPIGYLLARGGDAIGDWTAFAGRTGAADGAVHLLPFGLALSTLLSLLPQIGEQADYLRFLPKRAPGNGGRWWAALLTGGPGWVVIGGVKLLLGSLLVTFALGHGVDAETATSPTHMFVAVYRAMTGSPIAALALTGILVVVAQMKINVTNAYAGSIAWSNFFSRLTHAHPGRVVWLVFNVLLALLLMEVGIFRAIENILVLYANLAAGWIGALAADLVVAKPLGLSPKTIEFKRAHLYDINPVGVGAMALSILVSTAAMVGAFGDLARAFAPLLGLAVAFVAAPGIALATRSRFYLARAPDLPPGDATLVCSICENAFERPDMAYCPMHQGTICSLCCTLEARCHDMCKVDGSFGRQTTRLLERILPRRLAASVDTALGHFAGVMSLITLANGGVLYVIAVQCAAAAPASRDIIETTLWVVFFALSILSGIAAWLIVLAHDSRRAAERDTEHRTALLLDEVAAHTRTDAALQKAKDAAEAANVAKSRYLVGVSHEIRSPLNAIYGYAQLLERDHGLPRDEAARVIRRSSEHLTDIVDGLLDISRIESGVLKLSRDVVPLPALLAQIADMFRMQAAAKGIGFRYDPPPGLPGFVRTDEKRLRQILINLLSNAVKYTSSGHAALDVRYRGLVAEFRVSDTGIGIAAPDLDRIFEPFERAGADGGASGTGLGLAITRALAQVMGGEVGVTSTPGQGSVFTLRLMLAEPLDAPAPTARQRRITGYEGRRRTLLLVDDDPAQLAVLQGLLRPLGFTVYAASTGGAAIDLAQHCDPDLVLLDIQMPGPSGWTVAARLRTAHGSRLRIVMCSANAHESTASGLDHDGFVMKPVDLDTLLDVLAAKLGLSWTTAAAAPPIAVAAIPEALPLAELRRLGLIGHVRGIDAKLDEIARDHPEARAFTETLRDRVRAFDLKAYLKLLDAHG